MRKLIVVLILTWLGSGISFAQNSGIQEGKCDNNLVWRFDGRTLFIENTAPGSFFVSIPDYDLNSKQAPWVKKGFNFKELKIGDGIERIGTCAFANCEQLEKVEFYNSNLMVEIGWGAFLNCKKLFNFSMPPRIAKIGKIAFANCFSLPSVKIPSRAHVEDYAFLSCTSLRLIEIATTAELGKSVFAKEIKIDDKVSHEMYNGEIRGLPSNINAANCREYGLSENAVKLYLSKKIQMVDMEVMTSEVDTIIPCSGVSRNDTYALIIGNQKYRFVSDVPYANHDAKIFSEYCKRTLGIPAEHIHLSLDATKHMILEQEMGDWLQNSIADKANKKLIIYYAGHGVPDIEENNKSYLLPTDVYGTKPKQGIALDNFYTVIGNMGFKQVTIFMDACFCGITRDNESVNEGLRGTEIVAQPSLPTTGNLIVFSAAQGNETAQGYQEQGHGLFTYYLLRELQLSNGYLSYGRLANKLVSNVSKTSQTMKLRKKQTPTATTSQSIKSNWQKEPL